METTEEGVCLGDVILEARINEMVAALKHIHALATFELENPTGLHMTCLSMIKKETEKVVKF